MRAATPEAPADGAASALPKRDSNQQLLEKSCWPGPAQQQHERVPLLSDSSALAARPRASQRSRAACSGLRAALWAGRALPLVCRRPRPASRAPRGSTRRTTRISPPRRGRRDKGFCSSAQAWEPHRRSSSRAAGDAVALSCARAGCRRIPPRVGTAPIASSLPARHISFDRVHGSVLDLSWICAEEQQPV